MCRNVRGEQRRLRPHLQGHVHRSALQLPRGIHAPVRWQDMQRWGLHSWARVPAPMRWDQVLEDANLQMEAEVSLVSDVSRAENLFFSALLLSTPPPEPHFSEVRFGKAKPTLWSSRGQQVCGAHRYPVQWLLCYP